MGRNTQGIQIEDAQADQLRLIRFMMEKSLGSLVMNFTKAVMKSIPSYDAHLLREKLHFLQSFDEVALIAAFGVDTWDTPIKNLDAEQVKAALRGLSWLTSELVEKLSNTGPNPNNRASFIINRAGYDDFHTAINSLTPLRAAVKIREKEHRPAPPYASSANSQASFFSDVIFIWDPHYHRYHYQPCYFDYQHGHWHHCHHDYVWGHGHHHHYGHDFPVARALTEHVISPAAHTAFDMYGKLLDIQIEVIHGVIKLGGKAIEGTGEFLGHAVQALGDVASGSVHQAGSCIADGCQNILHFSSDCCHQTGDLFCSISHGAGHCAKDVLGGCSDVLGMCGNICCEMGKLCSHCGDCKCDCPSGGDGDACTVIMGAIGSCCYGTYALVKKAVNSCCGSDPAPAPDDSSGSFFTEGVIDEISGHEHYSAMTTTGTLIHAGLFGAELAYASASDVRMMFNSNASPRNQNAARIDCASRTVAIGAASAAAYLGFGTAYGLKVATNTAISAGVCAQTTSWTARKYHEKQAYGGITHPDKYFMKAGELNRLVSQNSNGLVQANRDQEVSTLDAVIRANTTLYREAKDEKNQQWALVRRTQALTKVVGCGAHAKFCTNPHETHRNEIIAQIESMRHGVLPTPAAPPSFRAQPYQGVMT